MSWGFNNFSRVSYNGYESMPAIGRDGKPITRTMESNPYNYDDFILWDIRGLDHENQEPHKNTISDYSDRLWQRNYNKYNRLCMKHFGDEGQTNWDRRCPKMIEEFLKEWYDDDVKLVRIWQGCHQANGFPIWAFECKRIKEDG